MLWRRWTRSREQQDCGGQHMAVMCKVNPKTNILTFFPVRCSAETSILFKMILTATGTEDRKRKREGSSGGVEQQHQHRSHLLYSFMSNNNTQERKRGQTKTNYIKIKKFQSWDWQKPGIRQNIYCGHWDGVRLEQSQQIEDDVGRFGE